MFDFLIMLMLKNNKVKDYKIAFQASDLEDISDLNVLRECGEKAFGRQWRN